MADNVHNNVKNAATILLYSVANADQNIEKNEIKKGMIDTDVVRYNNVVKEIEIDWQVIKK